MEKTRRYPLPDQAEKRQLAETKMWKIETLNNKNDGRGRARRQLRYVLNCILWVLRTGALGMDMLHGTRHIKLGLRRPNNG
jgi:hypothetical protein